MKKAKGKKEWKNIIKTKMLVIWKDRLNNACNNDFLYFYQIEMKSGKAFTLRNNSCVLKVYFLVNFDILCCYPHWVLNKVNDEIIAVFIHG